jgi:RNA polymerase sigma-70 factor (family 1)
MHSLPEEYRLVFALKNGSVKAFENLFSIYGNRVYLFSYGYLKSKEDSEEVVQEVFLRIWKNRKSLRSDLSFRSYLFKIAYHLIIGHFQKIHNLEVLGNHLESQSLISEENLEDCIDCRDALYRVDHFIDNLPPRQREVLIKRKKEGLPVKEIARQLNLSTKTVENHLTTAMKSLKLRFGDLL